MTDPENDQQTARPPAAPAWVKLLMIGIAVAVAVVLIAMVLIGGEHGPGRHFG